ncbi:adenylyltransferase/cytidyltransferase family protein [Arthrobacter sp. H35-D1]|uniref:adenylyltransferase/cytidyltransferase family protein n=1 Tax=Arthrobacter sp. H35-D1 TaxID=3046202 RepID=UPI0024B926C5|nr:adenylyltransferase/cytidyltransferase family protein [Arthrobacter sp. H35-D1]MDJ0312343.1 adenylyltransferase/cytidyltransferase family protein [Arthrobacter sp. H35-D1]
MGLKVGYAVGAFDLFHVGHLNILRQARSRCDFLIAGVVNDELCAEAKGHTPVIPLNERLEIVASISCVDKAVVEDHANRLESWQELHFDVFFKGDDWRGTAAGFELERQFSSVGVAVVYFPYTLNTSSTLLRRTLNRLNAPLAVARVSQDGLS